FIGNFNAVTAATLIGESELYGEDLAAFATELRQFDGELQIQTLLTAVLDESQVIEVIGFTPQLVVYRGEIDGVNAVMQSLAGGGWAGLVVYAPAFEARQAGLLNVPDGISVIGLNSWTNSAPDQLSQAFIASYLERTGLAPDAIAASAYDTTWAMRLMIERV